MIFYPSANETPPASTTVALALWAAPKASIAGDAPQHLPAEEAPGTSRRRIVINIPGYLSVIHNEGAVRMG